MWIVADQSSLSGLLVPIATALLVLLGHILINLFTWLRRKSAGLVYGVDAVAQKDIALRLLLAELGSRLDADRAYIASYHNGERFIDGSEIVRKTRSHEWVAPGVSYESERYQNMVVSLIPEEGRLVADAISFRFTAEIPEGRFRRLLETGNIIAVARMALRYNNDIIGFVGLDFLHHQEKPAGFEHTLQEYAWRIEEVFAKYRAK
jgi:hypothetical protein